MSFYADVIKTSKWFGLDNFVCKDMDMLEPGTRAAVLAVMEAAKASGVELRVLETYRSQRRQARLFAQGATKLKVVGCHGYGVAVDFGVFIGGKYQTKNGPYVFLRKLARKHGLISGQDWGHAHGKLCRQRPRPARAGVAASGVVRWKVVSARRL